MCFHDASPNVYNYILALINLLFPLFPSKQSKAWTTDNTFYGSDSLVNSTYSFHSLLHSLF